MQKSRFAFRLFVAILILLLPVPVSADKKTIKALYLPLADHYPGVVAFESYRFRMKKADFQLIQLKTPALVRAWFRSRDADMAFILSPIAMDMFAKSPDFRWVSLIHRDGNALAINDKLNAYVKLETERVHRKPDRKIADSVLKIKKATGRPVKFGVPSLQATHTVVLYKYLKDHGLKMNLGYGTDKEVLAIVVAPPKSPAFLRSKNSRNQPAAFEQSLPWADIVETEGSGKVAWYSKDVMKWPKGHVECIIIATDKALKQKTEAIREVIYYIHQAGVDIENARKNGGIHMQKISSMIQKHIPGHTTDAIAQSLRTDLNVINYFNLNIDKAGLKQIMDFAVEGGILNKTININDFADTRFSTRITIR